MDEMDLLIDLHGSALRQGPGSEADTLRAIDLSGLSDKQDLKIADIGCGSGASTLTLARTLDAQIVAVDFLPAFLTKLEDKAAAQGLSQRITTLVASMDALEFAPASLDAVWSEGAIYNMGFETGIKSWRPFLKPGGILAVSELTWLTSDRPAELTEHWSSEYAQVATASKKMAQLEAHGYVPVGYFPLPQSSWLDAYYRPMQERFGDFLARHGNSAQAQSIVDAERHEISLYERYAAFVSYGFYIARKRAD